MVPAAAATSSAGKPGAPQHHRAVDASLGEIGQVAGQHVHRYPTDGHRPFPVDQDRTSARCVSRITVGVAAGNYPYPRRPGSLEGSPVSHTLTGLDFLHRDDAAGQRHHRFQVQAFGIDIGKWARAVQHDARTHPAAHGLRMMQNGRRVGHGNRQVPAFGHPTKSLELPINTTRAVGFGKMRHQRHRGHGGSLGEFAPDGGNILRLEAEAVHSGIELEVDRETNR